MYFKGAQVRQLAEARTAYLQFLQTQDHAGAMTRSSQFQHTLA